MDEATKGQPLSENELAIIDVPDWLRDLEPTEQEMDRIDSALIRMTEAATSMLNRGVKPPGIEDLIRQQAEEARVSEAKLRRRYASTYGSYQQIRVFAEKNRDLPVDDLLEKVSALADELNLKPEIIEALDDFQEAKKKFMQTKTNG